MPEVKNSALENRFFKTEPNTHKQYGVAPLDTRRNLLYVGGHSVKTLTTSVSAVLRCLGSTDWHSAARLTALPGPCARVEALPLWPGARGVGRLGDSGALLMSCSQGRGQIDDVRTAESLSTEDSQG